MKARKFIFVKIDGYLHLKKANERDSFIEEFVIKLWDIFNGAKELIESALIRSYVNDEVRVVEEEALVIVKFNCDNEDRESKERYTDSEWNFLSYKEKGRILAKDFLVENILIQLKEEDDKKKLSLVKAENPIPKNSKIITFEEAESLIEKENPFRGDTFSEFMKWFKVLSEEEVLQ